MFVQSFGTYIVVVKPSFSPHCTHSRLPFACKHEVYFSEPLETPENLWNPLGACGTLLEASENLSEPLETSESLWEPLGASGSLWNLWEPLGASGNFWKPLGTSGNLWEPLGASGTLLSPNIIYSICSRSEEQSK